jgi:hypothetical protein
MGVAGTGRGGGVCVMYSRQSPPQPFHRALGGKGATDVTNDRAEPAERFATIEPEKRRRISMLTHAQCSAPKCEPRALDPFDVPPPGRTRAVFSHDPR